MSIWRRLIPLPVVLLLAGFLTPAATADIGRWTTTGPPGGYVSALAIDPTNDQVLYAGAGAVLGTGAGVFRSTDGVV